MNKGVSNILRWICILPAAILGYWAVFTINTIFGYALSHSFAFVRYIVLFFIFQASGLAFVVAGAKTAPLHQEKVSIVLAAIMCLIMIGGLYVQFTVPEDYLFEDKVWNCAVMLGAISGSIYIHAGE